MTEAASVVFASMDMRVTDEARLREDQSKRRRRYAGFIYSFGALVLISAAAWWLFGRGLPVTVATAARGNAAEIVYATGSVEPERWARVATIVTGRIVERCRCEGATVKTGQLLARLDDSEPKASLLELEAREEYARKELDRQQHLIERGATTVQAYDRVSAELMQIRGLISVQRERLSNYRLVSPMDGLVLREDGEVGEVVTSNTILYRIGLLSPLLLVAEVNEEDIPKVKAGQVVLLRSDAFVDQQLNGTVRDITPAGDPVARTYRIRVALPQDTPLQVGMSIEANIVVREARDAVLVPAASLARGVIYVVEDGRAVRRPVNVGIRGTQSVEIRAGIKDGEQVVSPVPADLSDGARVRTSEPDRPATQ